MFMLILYPYCKYISLLGKNSTEDFETSCKADAFNKKKKKKKKMFSYGKCPKISNTLFHHFLAETLLFMFYVS